jgi:anthranilate/para-aminobenzoate synthase component II
MNGAKVKYFSNPLQVKIQKKTAEDEDLTFETVKALFLSDKYHSAICNLFSPFPAK